MRRILMGIVLSLLFAVEAAAVPATWDGILEKARGQTVYWNAWAGDENTNAFIEWSAGRVKEKTGVLPAARKAVPRPPGSDTGSSGRYFHNPGSSEESNVSGWVRCRMASGGGHGGNNGVKSVNAHVGSPEYARVRVGVGRPPPAMDPVLKAGIAHFWFVTIHPLADGNCRIARAIAEMALSQADGTKERFYSMSSGIEASRGEYYQELESAQRGDLDITKWLAWFLECLDRTIENSDRTLGSVLHKAKYWQRINRHPVNERQRKVINRML
ncbi:MAG: hypothetical protein HGA84_03615, partial [Syntrophobacteraceae bacterium]|nr:hypothetical protein [Syntrophobacteraceae bacterium]